MCVSIRCTRASYVSCSDQHVRKCFSCLCLHGGGRGYDDAAEALEGEDEVREAKAEAVVGRARLGGLFREGSRRQV